MHLTGLLLAAVVFVLAGTATADIASCQAALNAALARSESNAANCAALDIYATCIGSIITQLAGQSNLAPVDAAENALAATIAEFPYCDLYTSANFRPYMIMDNSTAQIVLPQNKDIVVVEYNLESANLAELNSSIIEVAANIPLQILQKTVDSVSEVQQTADSFVAQSAQEQLNMWGTRLTAVGQAYDVAESQLNALGNTLATSLNAAVTQRTSMASTINNEAVALNSWQATIHSALTTTRLNLALGLNDDAIERAAISSDEAAYLAKLNGGVAASITGFIATENSRSAAKFVGLASDLNVVAVPISTDSSTAIADETTRAYAAIAPILASAYVTASTQTGGNDDTACTTAGVIYYSSSKGLLSMCNGAFYVAIPMVFNAFSASTILNTVQGASLANMTMSSRWTMCYSSAVNGWASTTFHSLCDNKGPTVAVALSSGGYIAGGFTNVPYRSINTYAPSSVSFLFKFTGALLSRTITIYPQYGTYDYNPYGPTFGGGHDWQTASSMNSGYCSTHSYSANGYSSTWMFGTSSFNLNKLEVFYMS